MVRMDILHAAQGIKIFLSPVIYILQLKIRYFLSPYISQHNCSTRRCKYKFIEKQKCHVQKNEQNATKRIYSTISFGQENKKKENFTWFASGRGRGAAKHDMAILVLFEHLLYEVVPAHPRLL
jgi:hypothetical protein